MIVANYDMMPTILGYLGLQDRMPTKPTSPGRDFSKVLLGKKIEWNNMMFFEYIETRAIRTDQWKLVKRQRSGSHELYDLTKNPGEWINLYNDIAYSNIQSELSQKLVDFFDTYTEPRHDLWHGGTSQTLLEPED